MVSPGQHRRVMGAVIHFLYTPETVTIAGEKACTDRYLEPGDFPAVVALESGRQDRSVQNTVEYQSVSCLTGFQIPKEDD